MSFVLDWRLFYARSKMCLAYNCFERSISH